MGNRNFQHVGGGRVDFYRPVPKKKSNPFGWIVAIGIVVLILWSMGGCS